MQRFTVTSQHFQYKVLVGRGAWLALRNFHVGRYSSLFVLTERRIWKHWRDRFLEESGLGDIAMGGTEIYVPSGERSKSLAMLERTAGQLAARGADRRSLLIAFGGGVIGDLGGFVASTYMRGIDYIQVPTTVVAQVDSAVGGKTAVNLGAIKNLVGTFYPARLVVVEPAVLSTLGEREFRSGLHEVVKHAILAGPAFFRQIESVISLLAPGDAESLAPMLARAVKVKVDIVNKDERESGVRMLLNLGHTYGHALEAATDYRRFLHGEAVGWGMILVVRLAERLGILAGPEARRITSLVRQTSPLPPIGDLSPARIAGLLLHDKKARSGKVHWVLPERIGKMKIESGVPEKEVRAAFRDIQRNAKIHFTTEITEVAEKSKTRREEQDKNCGQRTRKRTVGVLTGTSHVEPDCRSG